MRPVLIKLHFLSTASTMTFFCGTIIQEAYELPDLRKRVHQYYSAPLFNQAGLFTLALREQPAIMASEGPADSTGLQGVAGAVGFAWKYCL